jgi:hypothetical protein
MVATSVAAVTRFCVREGTSVEVIGTAVALRDRLLWHHRERSVAKTDISSSWCTRPCVFPGLRRDAARTGALLLDARIASVIQGGGPPLSIRPKVERSTTSPPDIDWRSTRINRTRCYARFSFPDPGEDSMPKSCAGSSRR